MTHVYETVYLVQQRQSEMLAVERARIQAELEALKILHTARGSY